MKQSVVGIKHMKQPSVLSKQGSSMIKGKSGKDVIGRIITREMS